MKKYIICGILLFVVGCGYSSRDNEMIGQVKKVVRNTPIICPEYKDADISLGILRGGVGSMSIQDVWVTIMDKDQENILRKANENGKLVKIKYDVKRVTFCINNHIITSVEILE